MKCNIENIRLRAKQFMFPELIIFKKSNWLCTSPNLYWYICVNWWWWWWIKGRNYARVIPRGYLCISTEWGLVCFQDYWLEWWWGRTEFSIGNEIEYVLHSHTNTYLWLCCDGAWKTLFESMKYEGKTISYKMHFIFISISFCFSFVSWKTMPPGSVLLYLCLSFSLPQYAAVTEPFTIRFWLRSIAASTMKYFSLSKQPISILNRISSSKWKWWKSIFYTLSSSTVWDSLLKIDKFLLSSIRKYVFLIYFTITTPAPARTALEIITKSFAFHFIFPFPFGALSDSFPTITISIRLSLLPDM